TIAYGKHHFPWHMHPHFYSFSLTLEGGADLMFANERFHTLPGDIIIVPPYVAHQTRVDQLFGYKIIRISHRHPQLMTETKQVQLIRNPKAPFIFLEWFNTLKERENQPGQHLAPAFIPELFLPHPLLASKPKWPEKLPLKEALHFIHQHYCTSIQLQEISEAASLSPSYFQRLFQKHLGLSPQRYVQSLRIDKAKEMIAGGLPLTEVAISTGFYDQSHFIKYFKLLGGMKPKKYQTLLKKS
ncbi:MAG: AraC family transcriptional regulator, partial [Bacteroidota bacterium]